MTSSTVATENVLRQTAARCWCGAPMPAPRATGRPRVSHNAACSRRRDALLQQWQRRQEWLGAWRAELRRGYYSDARVKSEIDQLRAEVEALERQLEGRRTE
jgi:hypothetical protein